jgi:hypothetical protein
MNQRLHFLPFVLSLALLLLPSVGLRAQETFTLVTDASTLSAGDRIVIANTEAGVAMSAKQGNNSRAAVTVSIADGNLTASSDVQVLTLGGSAGAWTFDTGNSYLCMIGNKNGLNVTTAVNANAQASIAIAAGAATVTFLGSGSRNTLRFNSSAKLFSCYSPTGSVTGEINIYRSGKGTVNAGRVKSIADFCALDDDSQAELYLADDLQARVVYASNDTVMLMDNTGVVMLVGVATNPAMTFGDHVAGYIRGKRVTAEGIPVFAPTTQTTSAFLVIAHPVTESDVKPVTPTGINTVVVPSVSDGIFYDLNGRGYGTDSSRLPQGIYIRDGKKWIIK